MSRYAPVRISNLSAFMLQLIINFHLVSSLTIISYVHNFMLQNIMHICIRMGRDKYARMKHKCYGKILLLDLYVLGIFIKTDLKKNIYGFSQKKNTKILS